MLPSEKDRRLIPRWRSSSVTICTGELDSVRRLIPNEKPSKFLSEKIVNWNIRPSIEEAAELVTGALVEGQADLGMEAARYLLSQKNAAPVIRELARRLVTNASKGDVGCSEQAILKTGPEDPKQLIRALRRRLHHFPRNGLLWVDLSRAYTILGLQEQAVRAMDAAISLLPGNRFVLRSAARLYVHIDDPDRAHHLLQRNERTQNDPWLAAAEIAVAMVAERSSRLVKTARNLLKIHEQTPLHITELAGSLATLELRDGSLPNARRLFKQSLLQPTENSVAQATWASRIVTNLPLTAQTLKTPLSFEARALNDYRAQNWKGVIKHCEEWLRDEPFSARPAELGSYVAAEALEDFRLSEKLARLGLNANPNDQMLLNNVAFALAKQDLISDARRVFTNISRPGSSPAIESTLLATEGLIRFREGDRVVGRVLYLQSMNHAKANQLQNLRAFAAINLAREETLARTDQVDAAIASAAEESKKSDSEEVRRSFEGLAKKRKQTKR